MIVKKWVELSEEVDVHIGADDIRCALAEAFARVNARDKPNRYDVSGAINSIAIFLNGLTDEHIAVLHPASRTIVTQALAKTVERFRR